MSMTGMLASWVFVDAKATTLVALRADFGRPVSLEAEGRARRKRGALDGHRELQ